MEDYMELARDIETLILKYEEQTGNKVLVVRWGIGLNPVDEESSEYKLTWADVNERYVSVEIMPV
jgi:hypothetical protein